MRKSSYRVAFLAGDGIGPEVMAEASRALVAVAHLHGFRVDEVHVPFGGEALTRSGYLLPVSTRMASLDADAVLVGTAREPALAGVMSELDLRATITRVRCSARGDVAVLGPLAEDASEWTVERAFELACSSRAHITSVEADGAWHELVDGVAERHDGVLVERLSLAAALPALAFEPERFDIVVTGPLYGEALGSVAASADRSARVAAVGRLAESGPGVFAPAHGAVPTIAGQGVANPSSMLLAAALMLGAGLGEHAAAETLAGAVAGACRDGVRTPDVGPAGVGATTREFADLVLAGLPGAVTNVEFYREAWAS